MIFGYFWAYLALISFVLIEQVQLECLIRHQTISYQFLTEIFPGSHLQDRKWELAFCWSNLWSLLFHWSTNNEGEVPFNIKETHKTPYNQTSIAKFFNILKIITLNYFFSFTYQFKKFYLESIHQLKIVHTPENPSWETPFASK